jgi:hypothetical protein
MRKKWTKTELLLAFRTDEGELSEQTIKDIEQSLEDIRAERTISMKQVKHKLNVK